MIWFYKIQQNSLCLLASQMCSVKKLTHNKTLKKTKQIMGTDKNVYRIVEGNKYFWFRIKKYKKTGMPNIIDTKNLVKIFKYK